MAGIALRLVAALCIAAMFALVKLAEMRGVNLIESLFYRFLVGLALVVPWLALGPGFTSVRTTRISAHFWRALVGLATMALNYLSFILLPLAEATAIGFAVPIFATLLALVLLSESVGIHRWAAIVLGFVGIMIVIQPGDGHIALTGALVALAGAFMTASVSILIRNLGSTEAATTTVFWFTALALPPLAGAMVFYGQPHDPMTWAVIGGIGLFGGIAQLALTGALRLAPVSVVLPMDYSSLIWATLLGWLIWSTWPGTSTWIGAPLIIASGLYIAWREHRRAKLPATPSANPLS